MSSSGAGRGADATGLALTLTAAFGFATVSITSQLAAEAGLGTFGYVTWRAITAIAILAPVLFLAIRVGGLAVPAPGDVPARQRRALVAASLANLLLNAAVLLAIARMGVALGMILFYTWPALVAIGANRLHGEPIDGRRALALALATAGLVLVILAPALTGGPLVLDPLGIGLALFAAAGQMVYTLIAARGFPSVPALAGTTTLVALAVPGNIVLALLFGAGTQVVAPLADPAVVPWAIAGGIVGSAIPGVALLAGIRRLGPTRSSILMMLEPVVGVGLAFLVLGESLAPVQLAGGALVVAAGVLLQLPGSLPGRGRRRR
ncbi:MAG: EamA family transporter [Chloroflexota bacterium]